MTLEQITTLLADIICKRSELGKQYGVFLVPEGLIEFIPEMGELISEINEAVAGDVQGDIKAHCLSKLSEKNVKLFNFLPRSISDQLLLDRDPHGNVQVSKIDTERLLILLLQTELEKRAKAGSYKGKFVPQSHFFGYEGRCALPSTFDSQYCYSIGLNAGLLVSKRCNGYMSCIKNVENPDVSKWTAAGCPLPIMMGIERRKGKDKPVITKALVELEGDLFKGYAAVRDKWAVLDCYRSPGPVQFAGANSDSIPFLVKATPVDEMIKQTKEHEEWETKSTSKTYFKRDKHTLGTLSKQRVQDETHIPCVLEKGNYTVKAIKKYKPYSALVADKLTQQFDRLSSDYHSQYFVEIAERNDLDAHTKYDDATCEGLNKELAATDLSREQRIGVVLLGRQAPGGNNIVDGLLRW